MEQKIFTGYMKGINLGGWLSQCSHEKDLYETFISEKDIETIASWGADHVRLPVDYNLVENPDGSYIEEGFSYIDRCRKWCEKYHLHIVLDLHKTAGYSFDSGENESGFFDSEELILRFINLWKQFAMRFGKYDEYMAFELLNEVTDPKVADIWNQIIVRTIKEIRAYAPKIKIITGGVDYCSVLAVKDICMPYDENIIYNFHCYAPFIFTHQGAYWSNCMDDDFRTDYPFTYRHLKNCTEKNCSHQSMLYPYDAGDVFPQDETINANYFETLFQSAVAAARERNVALYCGEYGVIDLASPESTLKWFQDINAVFQKYGIGRAAWNYKEKDFGLSRKELDSVRNELIKYL